CVPLTSVVTVIASCGVAVGLALQGGLSNLAGGIIIIILKPFKVGDYIIEGGVEGTVEAIGIFYTTLLTPDNKRVIIPNGSLMNSTVTAVNQLDTRRVDFKFSVSYSSDIDKVRKVIAYVAENTDKVLLDKGVDIFLSNHGESSIDFSVRVWSKTEDYWTVYFSINENVKKAFDKACIEIPFPQMDVHVKNN
ncbi:MAG: mechanosensitive ion channel, partial [Clostridia bacterium]|nr:mechanosensitive ion channel [Clostridia bacterium]